MSEFAYANKDASFEFETFEWDNVWIGHLPDNTRARVLYNIGDSFSYSTRRVEEKRFCLMALARQNCLITRILKNRFCFLRVNKPEGYAKLADTVIEKLSFLNK